MKVKAEGKKIVLETPLQSKDSLCFPILSAVGLRAKPATHLVKNEITNIEMNLRTKKYADGELWAQRVFGDPVEFRGAGERKDVRY